MLTSSSLYNVIDSGCYERPIQLTMLVIQADLNV